mgnify:CR=1 FL=1
MSKSLGNVVSPEGKLSANTAQIRQGCLLCLPHRPKENLSGATRALKAHSASWARVWRIVYHYQDVLAEKVTQYNPAELSEAGKELRRVLHTSIEKR